MKIRVTEGKPGGSTRCSSERASVLIIVLWVSFGLVALALYFAHSMSLELRAADNGVAALQAEKAIEGAARYVSNVLANAEVRGALPDTNLYYSAGLPVGPATIWLIGRGDESQDMLMAAQFGLTDENSKLNLNNATLAMLQMLPRMTQELAASIVDWRDTDDNVSEGGAESELYLRANPSSRCKNAPFETVEELRLVYGADLEILYGEDANLNGVLDPNENDGDVSPPTDNLDRRLDPGLLEYVTTYSREPSTTTNGTQRINVNAANFSQQVAPILQTSLGAERANAVLRRIGVGTGGGGRGGGPAQPATPTRFGSVLEFYVRSGLNASEFAEIEDQLRNPGTNGLVNVNTASETVLACIPGIGYENAPALVAGRRTQPRPLTSIAWIKDLLDQASATQAGPYLTGRSYQFSADIAATGNFGRGYRRVKFIFDTSQVTPRIMFRQDLTHVGWALGPRTLLAQQSLTRSMR